MSAKVQKRTSTSADHATVVRYVVVDAPTKEKAAPAKARRGEQKAARSPVTVLKTVKPANPYLRSPQEMFEVAKQAGIFTDSGKLKPLFG